MTDPAGMLRAAADRLEALAARTTPGEWRAAGGRIAGHPAGDRGLHRRDHGAVAEAWAASAAWITALSPAVAAPPAAWLRTAAAAELVSLRRSPSARYCSTADRAAAPSAPRSAAPDPGRIDS